MVPARGRQMTAHRGPQQEPERAAGWSTAGAAPTSGLQHNQQRPAESECNDDSAIAPPVGLWRRFSDRSEEG